MFLGDPQGQTEFFLVHQLLTGDYFVRRLGDRFGVAEKVSGSPAWTRFELFLAPRTHPTAVFMAILPAAPDQ